MNKKFIWFVFVIVLLLFAANFFYKTLWFGTLTITDPQKFTTIQIGQEIYGGSYLVGESIKVRPGTTTVLGFSPVLEPASAEVQIQAFSDEIVNLEQVKVPTEEISKKLVGTLPENYRVSDSKLLENNTWLVVGILGDGSTDGFISIYKFNNVAWEIVESGTGLDRPYLEKLSVPNSVISYIEGLDA